MTERINRRDCLRMLGLSGLTAGLGAMSPKQLLAEEKPPNSSGFASSIIATHKTENNQSCARIADGKVIQPCYELPVLNKTNVLVVGGWPAGVVAAIAAKRAGANVTLVERYGHLGGLWTGGLVLLVMGHIVKGGKQVCQ